MAILRQNYFHIQPQMSLSTVPIKQSVSLLWLRLWQHSRTCSVLEFPFLAATLNAEAAALLWCAGPSE